MSKRVPTSIWLVTLLSGVVLGILLGIALPQNTIPIGLALILGWLVLPLVLSHPGVSPPDVHSPLGVDYVSLIPLWLQWLVLLYYPLAMLVASICAYWILWSTGKKGQALLAVGLLACVSTLVCVPVSLVAPSLTKNGTYFVLPDILRDTNATHFALLEILAVWLNLLFSSGVGWCIACLIPKPKRRTAS